jgi:uncharacterized membrane-anchored protein
MTDQATTDGSFTRRIWIWVILAALVQSAILGWMIFDRNRLLATGREIVLPVLPVDPRSLFQGDYVRLGYDIGQVSLPDLPGQAERRTVYVTVQKSADGSWNRVATALTWPVSVSADQVVLAGQMHWNNAVFGIETFFVPEGKGRELEKLVGDRKITAAVVVDAQGKAALAGLLVDGQPAYREPWY